MTDPFHSLLHVALGGAECATTHQTTSTCLKLGKVISGSDVDRCDGLLSRAMPLTPRYHATAAGLSTSHHTTQWRSTEPAGKRETAVQSELPLPRVVPSSHEFFHSGMRLMSNKFAMTKQGIKMACLARCRMQIFERGIPGLLPSAFFAERCLLCCELPLTLMVLNVLPRIAPEAQIMPDFRR